MMNIKRNIDFCFADVEARFFQVKNGNKCHILVQDNSNEKDKPCQPKRFIKSDSTSPAPICEGHSWCLDRCIGIIDVQNKDAIYIRSENEVVEVEPFFRKRYVIEEDYPSGEIKTSRIHRHVNVLIPPDNPREELEKMVGCENIKKRLLEFKTLAEYNKACLQQSPDMPTMKIFLHSVFYGNPGTGKTTICKLYGALLKEVGLLSKGHVVVADRSTFSGDSFGDEEAIVSELLRLSRGGVLMIDEAYLLEGVHHEDPSQMVLPLLLSTLADENKKDFAVVLCGYKDKLDNMIEQNPGLYSRFVNRFEFKDYTLDELMEIAKNYLKKYGHKFSPKGRQSFRRELSVAMSESNKVSWANARTVKNMIEHTYIKRAMRYSKEGNIDRIITDEDIACIPYEHSRRIGF